MQSTECSAITQQFRAKHYHPARNKDNYIVDCYTFKELSRFL